MSEVSGISMMGDFFLPRWTAHRWFYSQWVRGSRSRGKRSRGGRCNIVFVHFSPLSYAWALLFFLRSPVHVCVCRVFFSSRLSDFVTLLFAHTLLSLACHAHDLWQKRRVRALFVRYKGKCLLAVLCLQRQANGWRLVHTVLPHGIFIYGQLRRRMGWV